MVLWIAACGLLAWFTRHRPVRGVALVLVLWAAVPAIAAHVLTGLSRGPVAFHPATWLVLSIVAVQLIFGLPQLVAALNRHIYVVVAVGTFICGAFATNMAFNSGGTRLLVDQVVAPFLVFWIVVAFGDRDRQALLLLRNTVLAVIAALCALAFVQLLAGRILFYTADYEALDWFHPEKFDRWMGTTDSPLVLSLGICIAAPLTVSLRRDLIRFALLGCYLVGVIITQSRTGGVMLAAILLYIVIRAPMRLWARTLYAMLMAIAGYVALTSTLASGLNARIANDTGSAEARATALRFFTNHWLDYAFTGQGLTSSYQIARNAGLITSLESSYLMYAVDTGIILATVYFGAQLCLILRHAGQKGLRGVTVAALVGFVLQHTFSAVAGANLSGTLIWVVIGMTVIGSSCPAARRPEPSRRLEPSLRAQPVNAP
nr:O-antigen ligase family protein [Microlunatus panaciterrae]